MGSLLRISEWSALVRVWLQSRHTRLSPGSLERFAESSDEEFCFAALRCVSRSFASVIQALPEEGGLRSSVCLFYLILRGLDTVEDDMSVPLAVKLPALLSFHTDIHNPEFRVDGVGQGDERTLLRHFHKVCRHFGSLSPVQQRIISDVTRRMGKGMAEFQEKHQVSSLAEYNLYCHYVAGLVGEGLSGLFSESGLEDESLRHDTKLANHMGRFLQKVNIIRDYLEDLEDDRTFWPKEVWHKYALSLASLRKQPSSAESLATLNEMVADALSEVPHCVAYMRMVTDQGVFRFCAIPQVMAMATLSRLYNQPAVFTSVVKIDKVSAASILVNTQDLGSYGDQMVDWARRLQRRIKQDDANGNMVHTALDEAIHCCQSVANPKTLNYFLLTVASVAFLVTFLCSSWYLFAPGGASRWGGGHGYTRASDPLSLVAGVAFGVSLAFFLGFFGLHFEEGSMEEKKTA